MRITTLIKLTALNLTLLVLASACSDQIDSASERVSGAFGESRSERLSQRVDDTIAKLDGVSSDIHVFASETVTLSELQAAGVPVGSNEIACDQPLDIVIVEGMFDHENLFSNGVAMAGGSFEALAMEMIAEIYDPETDMPLGMIGDQTGASLSGLTQSESGAIAAGSVDGSLILASTRSEDGEDNLIPQASCQE
jgi:hypothetical protein